MSRSMTKPTKWPVCPAKTQISLGIRPVRSVFTVHSTGSYGPKVSWCGQRAEDWSDWAVAQVILLVLSCWAQPSLITRKPVFGVCDQVRLKPACSTTETSWRLQISDIETRDIILSRQRITKALISCADAQADLRLCCLHMVKQVFSWCGSIMEGIRLNITPQRCTVDRQVWANIVYPGSLRYWRSNFPTLRITFRHWKSNFSYTLYTCR